MGCGHAVSDVDRGQPDPAAAAAGPGLPTADLDNWRPVAHSYLDNWLAEQIAIAGHKGQLPTCPQPLLLSDFLSLL